jgi:hypothetical protein
VKYIQLPEAVFKVNLNALQLLIYADVHTMTCQKMQYFRSNKQIGELFNRDVRNVQRAIHSMLEMGLLSKGDLNGMRTLTTKAPPVAKMSRGGGEFAVGGVAKVSRTGDKNATQVEKVSKSISTSLVEKGNFGMDDVVLPFEEPQFLDAWNAWKEYKRVEFNYHFKSKQAEQLALVKLKNDTQDANHAITAIGEAMASGWKSIQAPKTRFNNGGAPAADSPAGDAEAIARRDF